MSRKSNRKEICPVFPPVGIAFNCVRRNCRPSRRYAKANAMRVALPIKTSTTVTASRVAGSRGVFELSRSCLLLLMADST